MNDQRGKAFDFASDATKQLITLGTGMIALTVTFAHDLLAQVPVGATKLLMAAWLLELVSIASGVWTLLGLTGELQPTTEDPKRVPSIRRRNVTLPSLIQIVCFVLGTAMVVFFGIWVAASATATTPAA